MTEKNLKKKDKKINKIQNNNCPVDYLRKEKTEYFRTNGVESITRAAHVSKS